MFTRATTKSHVHLATRWAATGSAAVAALVVATSVPSVASSSVSASRGPEGVARAYAARVISRSCSAYQFIDHRRDTDDMPTVRECKHGDTSSFGELAKCKRSGLRVTGEEVHGHRATVSFHACEDGHIAIFKLDDISGRWLIYDDDDY